MNNVLSDGQPIEVRRLAFMELELQVPYPDPGLYIHTYIVDGHPQPIAYGLDDYAEIPERPKTSFADIQPGSYDEALWQQYNLYRAVLAHERKRQDVREQYLEDCAQYILAHCIDPADGERIVTPDDFKIVHRLALCPEVTEEDIVAVLAGTFQGHLEGKAFMEFDQKVAGIGRNLHADQAVGASVNVSVTP
jgi:hypothetical protein